MVTKKFYFLSNQQMRDFFLSINNAKLQIIIQLDIQLLIRRIVGDIFPGPTQGYTCGITFGKLLKTFVLTHQNSCFSVYPPARFLRSSSIFRRNSLMAQASSLERQIVVLSKYTSQILSAFLYKLTEITLKIHFEIKERV